MILHKKEKGKITSLQYVMVIKKRKEIYNNFICFFSGNSNNNSNFMLDNFQGNQKEFPRIYEHVQELLFVKSLNK